MALNLNAYENLHFENKEKVIIVMLTTSTAKLDIEKFKTYKNVVSLLNKPLADEKLKNIIEKYFS